MKTAIISAILLVTGVAPSAADVTLEIPDSLTTFEGDKVPSIYLLNSEGGFSAREHVVMTPYKDTGAYVARCVDVENGGFRFLAVDEQSGAADMRWFVGSPEGVKPVLEQYFNPLSPLDKSSEEQYIAVTPGVYDIYYMDQQTPSGHCHLYAYAKADTDNSRIFPPNLYLLSADGGVIVIPETDDGTGIYEASVSLPDNGFKVSYQNYGFDIPAYQFGPQEATQNGIVSRKIRNLDYGRNTYAQFSYEVTAPEGRRLVTGEDVYVKINLADPVNTLEVVGNEVSELPELDEDVSIVAVHDIEGVAVPVCALCDSSLASGIYIVTYSDGSSVKYLIP